MASSFVSGSQLLDYKALLGAGGGGGDPWSKASFSEDHETLTVIEKLNFLEIPVPLAPCPSEPHTQARERGRGSTGARGAGGPRSGMFTAAGLPSGPRPRRPACERPPRDDYPGTEGRVRNVGQRC